MNASFKRPAIVLTLAFSLVGCAELRLPDRQDPAADPTGTGEIEDSASETDEGQAAEPVPGGALGTTLASLGDPAEGGLWIKTPLVNTERPGRIRNPATGAEVEADLKPLDAEPGSGSRMSLAAFQALGFGLTELPEVELIAD